MGLIIGATTNAGGDGVGSEVQEFTLTGGSHLWQDFIYSNIATGYSDKQLNQDGWRSFGTITPTSSPVNGFAVRGLMNISGPLGYTLTIYLGDRTAQPPPTDVWKEVTLTGVFATDPTPKTVVYTPDEFSSVTTYDGYGEAVRYWVNTADLGTPRFVNGNVYDCTITWRADQ